MLPHVASGGPNEEGCVVARSPQLLIHNEDLISTMYNNSSKGWVGDTCFVQWTELPPGDGDLFDLSVSWVERS